MTGLDILKEKEWFFNFPVQDQDLIKFWRFLATSVQLEINSDKVPDKSSFVAHQIPEWGREKELPFEWRKSSVDADRSLDA